MEFLFDTLTINKINSLDSWVTPTDLQIKDYIKQTKGMITKPVADMLGIKCINRGIIYTGSLTVPQQYYILTEILGFER